MEDPCTCDARATDPLQQIGRRVREGVQDGRSDRPEHCILSLTCGCRCVHTDVLRHQLIARRLLLSPAKASAGSVATDRAWSHVHSRASAADTRRPVQPGISSRNAILLRCGSQHLLRMAISFFFFLHRTYARAAHALIRGQIQAYRPKGIGQTSLMCEPRVLRLKPQEVGSRRFRA